MEHLNHVHLNGLRAVEVAGRLGTLALAAEELGVSIGAVSQQILKTEQQLGRTLFTRTPKGLVPTPFGTQVLAYFERGFRELSRGVALAQEPNQNLLTVSVAPVFAAKWLVPRLHSFQRAHPDLHVRIDSSIELVDLDHSDVDLAIRVGPGTWPDVKAELLLEQRVFPICAPALAARLKTPRDLAKLPIIYDRPTVTFNIFQVRWNIWLALHEMDEGILVTAGPSFSDSALCLDAAIAGQGVMLGWHTLAMDALADGRLVKPFIEEAETDLGYYLVTSLARGSDKKIAAFKAWIRQEIRPAGGG
jgi:LysR family transcriptional regulator, glycine cleavage system transcriptional activator